MALAVLLAASAGFTAGVTKLRGTAARWLVVGTLASLGMLVQVPALSRLFDLQPLHIDDWALVGLAFAATVLLILAFASRLTQHAD